MAVDVGCMLDILVPKIPILVFTKELIPSSRCLRHRGAASLEILSFLRVDSLQGAFAIEEMIPSPRHFDID